MQHLKVTQVSPAVTLSLLTWFHGLEHLASRDHLESVADLVVSPASTVALGELHGSRVLPEGGLGKPLLRTVDLDNLGRVAIGQSQLDIIIIIILNSCFPASSPGDFIVMYLFCHFCVIK